MTANRRMNLQNDYNHRIPFPAVLLYTVRELNTVIGGQYAVA